MKFHILQHVDYEGPGIIADWASVNGHEVGMTRVFEEGFAFPGVDEFDCLVVMGGPMSVYDDAENPWLAEEKAFIREAIEKERRVLGICLGAQLIAAVLGARVRRNQHREIGWGPISLTEKGAESDYLMHMPEELDVFHWHSETFDIPEGAVHLAQSAGCLHQAFLYGKHVLGLQFHLEVTRKDVVLMLNENKGDLTPDTHVQPASKILARENPFRRANHAMRGILLKMVTDPYQA